MSVIKTEHLTHTYSQGTSHEQAAVSDVNLEIEAGEMIGVIGHTGSGKSTLIQHFNGRLRPTSAASVLKWGWCSNTRNISCLKIRSIRILLLGQKIWAFQRGRLTGG